MRDLRYAFRVLRNNLTFTIVAIFTLALAIGASTAVFSAVNAVLLKSLPYPDSHRLAVVWATSTSFKTNSDAMASDNGDFYSWQAQSRSFESLAAFREHSFDLSSDGIPSREEGIYVTDDFFRVLRVEPFLGRAISAEDDQPGANHVVVLSYPLWRSRYSADPNIIGKKVRLDSQDYSIVGVMPSGFQFPSGPEFPGYFAFPLQPALWTPFGFSSDEKQNRGPHSLAVMGRLNPDIGPGQANSELRAIAQRLEWQYPYSNSGWSARVLSLEDQAVGGVHRFLWILFVAVLSVLLVACANVAGLLLARAQERRQEIAIRHALGATQRRIVSQLLAESLMLSIMAGLLGCFFASVLIRSLRAFGPQDFPRLTEIALDGRVLAFTIGISVLTGIVFGLAPALEISHTESNQTMNQGHNKNFRQGSVIGSRNALVIAQLAFSLVLLTAAGLMVRSFLRLQQVNPGFNSHSVLTAGVEIPRIKYSQKPQVVAFFREASTRLQALPGVESAGAISSLPLSNENEYSTGLAAEGYVPPPGQIPPCLRASITPGYIEAVGTPLERGRLFDDTDGADAPLVAIVNETLASRFFAGQDPIGRHIKFGRADNQNPWIAIVGVIGDTHHSSLETAPMPEVYLPYTQKPDVEMTFALRTRVDPISLSTSVRQAIAAVDPEQAVGEMRTMEEIVSSSMTGRRFNVTALSIFAGLALLLAAAGLYGLMSFLVVQRNREIGIRMALGASRGDILRMIVFQGTKIALVGVGIGAVGAFALTKLIGTLLFGIRAADLLTFLAVPALFVMVCVLACLLPGMRATRIDPLSAIRYE